MPIEQLEKFLVRSDPIGGDPVKPALLPETFVYEQRKHRQTILRRLLRLARGVLLVGGVAYLVFLALADRPINQTHGIPQATIPVDKKQAIVPADQKQSIAPMGQKQAMILADQKQAIVPVDQNESIITNDKQQAIIPDHKQEAIVPDKQQAIVTDDKQQATISSRSMHDAPKGHCWARWSRNRRVQITCVGIDRERPRR